MKKLISLALSAALLFSVSSAKAQSGEFSFNTRAWSTNYFATMFYGVVAATFESVAFKEGTPEAQWADRIIPDPSLVFPVALTKRRPMYIYGPYHRAFKSPFKHLGDWGIGADASYKSSIWGVYAGAYVKSQELVFKGTKDNIRGYYFQPRAGIIIGNDINSVELGIFYDAVAGCSGSVADHSSSRIKEGFGLDFALSSKSESGNTTVLQFSMPLHSFLNTNYHGQSGCKRKIAYIMLSRRIVF